MRLSLAQIAKLFATYKQDIRQCTSTTMKDCELNAPSAVKKYFTAAAGGKGYNAPFYSPEL